MWAWLGNWNGQFGDGTNNTRFSPAKLTSINNVVVIAAGLSSSVALKSDGTVLTWGGNGAGQICDGTAAPCPVPITVNRISGAVDVALSTSHVIALTRDGSVSGWGADGSGQLAVGGTSGGIRRCPVLTFFF